MGAMPISDDTSDDHSFWQIELNGGLPFELKVPDKILAEKKLMEELALGEKSGEEQGWLDLAASKARLGL